MTFQEATNENNLRAENLNHKSSDELLNLKKELANEIVDKILEKDSNLFSVLFKWSVSDYLVDENNIGDTIHDEIMLEGLWQTIWLITSDLKRYRDMLSGAKTKDDLENLKTTIFNEISWTKRDSTDIQESWTPIENSDTIDNNWVIGKACQIAVNIANDNSYWYESWWTGNNNGRKWFDCQSFVRYCCIQAWINVPKSWWCGSMKRDFEKAWFECINFDKNEKLKPWDILVDPKKHTEICVAEDKIAWAHSNKDKKAWDSGWEEISVRSIKSSLSYRNPQYILRYKWESA